MFRTASPVNTDGNVSIVRAISRRKTPKFVANRPDILSAKVPQRTYSQEEAMQRLRLA